MARQEKRPPPIDINRRVPPNDVASEMAVLGGILMRNESIDIARDLLQPEDFYHPAHQRLFIALCELFDKQETIDPVTLRSHLKAKDWLEEIGGAAYIQRLLDEVHTTANIESYARTIAHKSMLRKLINGCFEVEGMAFDQKDEKGELLETADILNRAQSLIMGIDIKELQSPQESVGEILQQTLAMIDERQTSTQLIGEPTGFTDLDEITNGFKEQEMILVAARPSMGKTALALEIAKTIAIRKPVMLFSLEMGNTQIGSRLICSEARVNLAKILKGRTTEIEMQQIADASGLLAERKIFVSDRTDENISSIRSKARRLKLEHGELGAIIIDYIQLMEGVGRFESREREIASISRGMKKMAKELDCPVLALSQLNRLVEKREDKRPMLSDLRESGALENDADLAIFLYRDVVYHPECEDPIKCELLIRKNRNGPTGIVNLAFIGEYTRFENYETRQEY